jgi:DNA-binding MarR family transcriptional regulator
VKDLARIAKDLALRFVPVQRHSAQYIVLRYIRLSIRMEKTLALSDYQALAELRYQIRLFLRFSEEAARKMSLEPQQHQLMLALKGLPSGMRPTIGALAERMQIQHHSAVELVNRLSAGGLVRRNRSGEDRRQVLLGLTPKGEKVLRELSIGHQAELRSQGPALVGALERAMRPTKGARGSPPNVLLERSGEAGQA